MRSKWMITAAVLGLSVFGLATGAQAKSVNYSAVKYGTNKSSIASKYFVKPAKVVVKHKRYVVTMHLKTGKSLGKYPVNILKVNGAKPQHVRKSRDKKGNYNIYYSFKAKSLKKKITAKLSINVLHVYKATHSMSFKFKTSQLPKLKSHVMMHATAANTVKPRAKVNSVSVAAKKGPALLPVLQLK